MYLFLGNLSGLLHTLRPIVPFITVLRNRLNFSQAIDAWISHLIIKRLVKITSFDHISVHRMPHIYACVTSKVGLDPRPRINGRFADSPSGMLNGLVDEIISH